MLHTSWPKNLSLEAPSQLVQAGLFSRPLAADLGSLGYQLRWCGVVCPYTEPQGNN